MDNIFSARLNIQLAGTSLARELLANQWQTLLSDAAIEGYAGDFEVFYAIESGVVGICVPYEEDDPRGLLEAGSVLGFCLARYEAADLDSARASWMSLHDQWERTTDSPI